MSSPTLPLRSSSAQPREGGRGTTGGRSHWFQHSLIVVETALAVVLLTCSGLLLQTFQHLRSTDLGFNRERLLTFETPLFRYTDFERRVAFINAEVEKVRAIPGVISAGSINLIPFTNFTNATFYLLEGQSRDRASDQVALGRDVSRDYFATVGARLRDGRFFDPSDRRASAPVAIVNEAFAKRHFPERSPLGQKSRLMTTLLYGVRPDYLPTAAVVSLILVGVAALACFVPARRASRIDPMIALRQD